MLVFGLVVDRARVGISQRQSAEVRLEPDKDDSHNEATKTIVVGEQPFAAGFVVVKRTRKGRTSFEYECRVVMKNDSPVKVEDVQLELVDGPNNMTIIKNPPLALGDIDANGAATSTGTCTFKVDRSILINPAEITWRATFTVEIDNVSRTAELTFSNVVAVEPVGLVNGDITGDGNVDYSDLKLMAEQWLSPPGTLSADIAPAPGGDGVVNFLDFTELAENWWK